MATEPELNFLLDSACFSFDSSNALRNLIQCNKALVAKICNASEKLHVLIPVKKNSKEGNDVI